MEVAKVVIGNAKLYLGDSNLILDCIESADALVTDPPYGLGKRSGTVSIQRNRNAYSEYDDTREAISEKIVPIVKRSLSICGGRGLITPGGKCAWLYPEPVDIGMLYQPATCSMTHWGKATCQPVLFYGKDPLSGKKIRPIHFTNNFKTEGVDHPCPKPVEVMEWMVDRASVHGETVLDPFMGSGTTGVACASLGRSFIGIEIDKKYFDIACERIAAAQSQIRLFQ